VRLSINNTQHSNVMPLCFVSLCLVSHFIYCYAECRYAECRYAKCRYAECRYTKCRGAIIHTSHNKLTRFSSGKRFHPRLTFVSRAVSLPWQHCSKLDFSRAKRYSLVRLTKCVCLCKHFHPCLMFALKLGLYLTKWSQWNARAKTFFTVKNAPAYRA
jgi:hypothetical protein